MPGQSLFPCIGKQCRLILKHVDEFVLTRASVMQCGHCSGRQASEVHTETLETEQIPERTLETALTYAKRTVQGSCLA